jgi:hypothetical protein
MIVRATNFCFSIPCAAVEAEFAELGEAPYGQ